LEERGGLCREELRVGNGLKTVEKGRDERTKSVGKEKLEEGQSEGEKKKKLKSATMRGAASPITKSFGRFEMGIDCSRQKGDWASNKANPGKKSEKRREAAYKQ